MFAAISSQSTCEPKWLLKAESGYSGQLYRVKRFQPLLMTTVRLPRDVRGHIIGVKDDLGRWGGIWATSVEVAFVPVTRKVTIGT